MEKKGDGKKLNLCLTHSIHPTHPTQLTCKKTTMQYKALDQAVQMIGDDGRKVSTTYRCSDMDKVVPALIGVDSAILDAVVFVHQDEATWPLGDTTTLKKKFDDIFAATKYTKALETLRKVKLETGAKHRASKLELDALQAELAHATTLRTAASDAAAGVEAAERELARARGAGGGGRRARARDARARAAAASAAVARVTAARDAATAAHSTAAAARGRVLSLYGEAGAAVDADAARARARRPSKTTPPPTAALRRPPPGKPSPLLLKWRLCAAQWPTASGRWRGWRRTQACGGARWRPATRPRAKRWPPWRRPRLCRLATRSCLKPTMTASWRL